ncbi:hypothetical protein C0989_005408 [Termitomyces sp. Mn162]|nr:hypothetical protein C0989_005408 [Termitomyces sp. Mn162]
MNLKNYITVLAIPLHTSPYLHSQIGAFQARLLNPLHTNPTTKRRSTSSSDVNFTKVRGLDSSIVIPPIRFHLTLGVMALSPEFDVPPQPSSPMTAPNSSYPPESRATQSYSTAPQGLASSNSCTMQPVRTVTTALALLQSLKPQIDATLRDNDTTSPAPMGDAPPVIPTELEIIFDALDILRPTKPPQPPKSPESNFTPTQVKIARSTVLASTSSASPRVKDESSASKSTLTEPQADTTTLVPPTMRSLEQSSPTQGNDIWADVLYLAPRLTPPLRQIAGDYPSPVSIPSEYILMFVGIGLVHGAFRQAGYITDTRLLKLHCTVLNTSKRRPAGAHRQPFCFSDILQTDALKYLIPQTSPAPSIDSATLAKSTTTSTAPSLFTSESESACYPVSLGPDAVVQVHGVELWTMGSQAADGAYVSCGGIKFGDVHETRV